MKKAGKIIFIILTIFTALCLGGCDMEEQKDVGVEEGEKEHGVLYLDSVLVQNGYFEIYNSESILLKRLELPLDYYETQIYLDKSDTYLISVTIPDKQYCPKCNFTKYFDVRYSNELSIRPDFCFVRSETNEQINFHN